LPKQRQPCVVDFDLVLNERTDTLGDQFVHTPAPARSSHQHACRGYRPGPPLPRVLGSAPGRVLDSSCNGIATCSQALLLPEPLERAATNTCKGYMRNSWSRRSSVSGGPSIHSAGIHFSGVCAVRRKRHRIMCGLPPLRIRPVRAYAGSWNAAPPRRLTYRRPP
jgi:hypothetical protein